MIYIKAFEYIYIFNSNKSFIIQHYKLKYIKMFTQIYEQLIYNK